MRGNKERKAFRLGFVLPAFHFARLANVRSPMTKPWFLPAILTLSVCLALTRALAAAAGGAALPAAQFRFPERPPAAVTVPPYIRNDLAKAKVGATRQDVSQGLTPRCGSMLSPIESYAAAGLVPVDGRHLVFQVDCLFQPASMTDSQFAAALEHPGGLRRDGSWPQSDFRDVLRAVSKPYLAPAPRSGAIEPAGLSAAARDGLQSLRMGLTRRELWRDFEPANGRMHPPTEPWALRHASAENRYRYVLVEMDFKPAAMDANTYASPELRAAWYRNHAWFPGEDPNDTVMNFYKPQSEYRGDPPIAVAALAAPDLDRLRTLRLGITRKEVLKTFSEAGGFRTGNYYLPKATVPRGFFGRAKGWVTVDIEFAPAGGGSGNNGIGGTGSNPAAARVARMPRDILHPPIVREAGSDVVVGFSRPYASIASSATD